MLQEAHLFLLGLMAAYRATVHEATGYSPNFVMFGMELRVPIDLVLERPGDAKYPNPDVFVEAVRLDEREAYALARDHLGRRTKRNKTVMKCWLARPSLRLAIGSGITIRGGLWDDHRYATNYTGSFQVLGVL